MQIPGHLEPLLEERTAEAIDLLRQAIQVDVVQHVSEQVEKRLRKRPHFLGRTPPQALAGFRNHMARRCHELLAEMGPKIRDLRAYYGAVPKAGEVEKVGLSKVLASVEEVTRELLLMWSMPGDDKPDRTGDRAVDLDPRYELAYEPSPAVFWAWERLRGIDRARFQIMDATELPPERSYEISLHLPEALPPDTSKPNTID